MCNSQIGCGTCPIYKASSSNKIYDCLEYAFDRQDDVLQIVQKWSDDNSKYFFRHKDNLKWRIKKIINGMQLSNEDWDSSDI